MSAKKEPKKVKYRIPPEVDGIQVNFCKNPSCRNFGIPAKEKSRGQIDRYSLSGGKSSVKVIKCLACDEHPPLKSNSGIKEELTRIQNEGAPKPEASCPNKDCINHSTPVSSGKAHYQSFGFTPSGSRRYRCKSCAKTFSVGTPTQRQRFPGKNSLIFKLLMNKSPFNRICEVAEIHPETLYQRIGFFSDQCKELSYDYEKAFSTRNDLPKLYLSSDRQEYIVNWSAQRDKRNITLRALGTADIKSGYVFGMHLDFDSKMDPEFIENDAIAVGDYLVSPTFRKYARLWLKQDYYSALLKKNKIKTINQGSVEEQIENSYLDSQRRADVEVPDTQDVDTKLPINGMQVHSEYTMYAHFFYLKELLSKAPKLRFYLDQDSGIRAACLAAFQERVLSRTVDAFYVHINKDLTVNEKRFSVAESKAIFDRIRSRKPEMSEEEVKVLMIKKQLKKMKPYGKWKDQWLLHPLPNMGEPEKAVCYLTNLSGYDPDHLARLYNKATLHPIDRYFMQVRRRISLLERPMKSSSRAQRMWHGYSAYNPEVVAKLLVIFRTFYNYTLAGKDKKTPAMRLGITQKKLDVADIIEFISTSKSS